MNVMCESDKFQFPVMKGNRWSVDLSDILYFEPEESLTLAYYRSACGTKTEQKYVNLPIGDLEKLLAKNGFYRSHRICLLNVSVVQPYGKYPDVILEIQHGLSVPLSRRKRQEFHNIYLEYQKSL